MLLSVRRIVRSILSKVDRVASEKESMWAGSAESLRIQFISNFQIVAEK